MASPKKIGIVATSTRTPRVGPRVAELIKATIESDAAASDFELEIIDVADYNLPLYDEANVIPAMVPYKGQFAHEHSKRWSEAMTKFDAYVFVIPEYNFGMAGSTKNAVDYLYNGFGGKPVVIVSYGINGGNAASDQLKQVLTGMKLKVAETRPALSFIGGNQGPDLMAAMFEGKIGDTSKAEWEKEAKLHQAFGELRTLLADVPVVATAEA